MSSLNIDMNINDQEYTCCICFQTTPSNNNFNSWNCSGPHPEIICNKCHCHIKENHQRCPICRAEIN